MSFGIFEAAVSSDQEQGLTRQASVDALAAAVYDVREQLGPVLFASATLAEFRNKSAMMRGDGSVHKIVGAHLPPITGTVRKIIGNNGALEQEFKALLATGAKAQTEWGDTEDLAGNDPGSWLKTHKPSKVKQETLAKRRQAEQWGDPDSWSVQDGKDADEDRHYPKKKTEHGQSYGEVTPENYWDGAPSQAAYASRRNADFDGTQDIKPTFSPSEGDLKPDGDFDSYLDSVDQNSSKVQDRNFTSSLEFQIYADWCEANRDRPSLNSLDRYAANLEDGQYLRLARAIQAWEFEHKPATGKGQSKKKLKDVTANQPNAGGYYGPGDYAGNGPASAWNDHPEEYKTQAEIDAQPLPGHSITNPETGDTLHYNNPHTRALQDRLKGGEPIKAIEGPSPAEANRQLEQGEDNYGHYGSRDPMRDYTAWCQANDLTRISARNVAYFAGGDTQLCLHLAQRVRAAVRVAHQRSGGQRTSAADYLQKANDALTQLLNQKAEEFQETIAPLQQALVTVQQATQIQQSQNPMSVLPPPGTVNVMPGGDQGPAGMPAAGAQDLGAAAQALAGGDAGAPPGGAPPGPAGAGAPGGGVPDDQGGPPPAAGPGGGLPPELAQQMQAKRGGRGKGRGASRPRQAGVTDLWNHYQQQLGQSGNLGVGGAADYEDFANKYQVGPRALQKLKTQHGVQDLSQPITAAKQRYLGWCAYHGLKADSKTNYRWYEVRVGRRDRQLLAEAKQVNHVEEAVKGQWRQMDAQMAQLGYKFDKGLNHWTKPGQKAVRNHWQHTGGQHDYRHGDPDQIFAPQHGYEEWNHQSGPSGPPYVRPQDTEDYEGHPLPPHRHEATAPEALPARARFPGRVKDNENGQLSNFDATDNMDNSGTYYDQYGHHSESDRQLPLSPELGGGRWSHDDLSESKWPQHRPSPYDENDHQMAMPTGPDQGGDLHPFWQSQGYTKPLLDEWRTFAPHTQNASYNDMAEFSHTLNLGRGEGAFNDPKSWAKFQSDKAAGQGYPLPKTSSRKQAWMGWGPAQFPKRQVVAGWDWDNHLNGYVANQPRQFECACGEPFPAPSGFHRCACGKQWNSYVIGTGGSNHEASAEKFLVREIPTRENVIVANRQLDAADDEQEPVKEMNWPGWKRRNLPLSEHEDPRVKRDQDWQGWVDQGAPHYGQTLEAAGLHQKDPRGEHAAPVHGFNDWLDEATGLFPPSGTPVQYGNGGQYHADPFLISQYDFQHGDYKTMHQSPGKPPVPPGRHRAALDPVTGAMHDLVDPGQLGDGEDPGTPAMKQQPSDWANRGDGARWLKSPIGK